MGGAEDYAGRAPVTADVQRELAEALAEHAWHGLVDVDFALTALLPTVQALIADAEKRAAAAALESAAEEIVVPGASSRAADWLRARAAALDPSGAVDGAQT